jgi:hypothetical protein
MSKTILYSLLTMGLAVSAGATTVTLGGAAPAGSTAVTFGPTLAATSPGVWTGTTGAGTANTSVANTYLDPLPGAGYYAYTEQGSTITATFAGGITSFDLLWGSPDAVNTITFSGPGGSVSYSPGVGLLAGLVPTDTNASTSMVLFTATPGVDWTSVSFTSGINSFEFGQVAFVAAASPEPASIALLAGGFLAIGAGALRKKRKA